MEETALTIKTNGENMQQLELSDYEQKAAQRAHHRALILQILKTYPRATTQQIIQLEQRFYSYTFLTDNRLRELVKLKLIGKDVSQEPCHWILRYEVLAVKNVCARAGENQ
jgi:hypothetical protein